jgi:hypothetical protein
MSIAVASALTVAALLLLGPVAAGRPLTPTNLAELLPGQDYAVWYQTQVGVAPNPTYFGAYALRAAGPTLYAGFGTARPGENGNSGGLLASVDGVPIALNSLLTLTEEGFIDIEPAGSALYIPGPDPTDVVASPAHQWDWGNFYAYAPPGPGVKYRNLPDVIHTWGAWWDGSQLYAAVSAHLGDYTTWSGQVFRTTDPATGWTLLADRDDGVGQYRTYEVIGFDGKLYVTWNDVYPTPCGLAVSSDGGSTWARLAAPDTQCRSRLIVFADKLLALNLAQTGFVAVDTSGNIATFSFAGFVVTDWAYNYAAVDSASPQRLYVVTVDGRIMRTTDLSTWQTMAATDLELITLGYWPDKNWLIAADRGSAAKLWRMDLDEATPITPLPAPAAPSAAIGGETQDELQLDWSDVPSSAGYRVYRSTDPTFTASAAHQIATPTVSNLRDDNIGGANVVGDVTKNYFYAIRAVDAAGNLSTWSQRIGEFDFSLTPGVAP